MTAPTPNALGANDRSRLRYIQDVYARYWEEARPRKYGITAYDQCLRKLVVEQLKPPRRVLEVAVGTGSPFAGWFAEQGYEVHAFDVADRLIGICRRQFPEVNAVLAAAEAVPYASGAFDATCCFHSTWYFPNLRHALDEMVRVTRRGGTVFFDIQNAENERIAALHRRRQAEAHGLRRPLRMAKNLSKFLLGRAPLTAPILYETPVTAADVAHHLQTRGQRDARWFGRGADGTLVKLHDLAETAAHERVVVAVTA